MAAGARVVVLGAGPVGLGAAVNIQEGLPALDLTLMADKFSPNVTANASAGFLVVHALGKTPAQLSRKWLLATREHCRRLYTSDVAAQCGVSRVSGHMLFDSEMEDPDWTDLIDGFRRVSQTETLIESGHYKTTWAYTTYQLECSIYLPWLLDRFRKNGGKVIKKKAHDLKDLRSEYDIIVNCTGIGAHELGDTSVVPLRGQAIRVNAPWVKNFIIINDGENYIIPSTGSVLLGGTHQVGNWNEQLDDTDRQHIINGCAAAIPALKKAPILSEWVGLRPGRDRVRLEVETIKSDGLTTKIIHNYGHGGAGVGLHWGCGIDVADLVQQSLKQLASSSSHHTKSKI